MLGQRVRDPLSLPHPNTNEDCLWQSRSVPTILATTEEAGAMGESYQLNRLHALQPQGVENHQQTYWQVWTLLPRVTRLSKFHRLAVGEARGTQDWRPRASQQGTVRPMEDSSTCGSQYLWTLQVGRVCCCHQTPEAMKISRIGLHLPGVYNPCRVGSQILVLQLPWFLRGQTQNSKDLEKSTSSCGP